MSNSVTLMDRAKALVTSKNCAAAALAIVPLAAAPAKAQTSWTMTQTFAYGGFGPGGWTSQATPIADGLKFTGQFGQISGSNFLDNEYGSDTTLEWRGEFTGTIHPGQRVHVEFDFVPTFSGGTLQIERDFFRAADLIVSDNLPQTLTSGVTYHYSALTPVAASAVTGGEWLHTAQFNWTNFAPADTLTITVAADASQFAVVPEPAGGAALMLSALALVARRCRGAGT